MLRRVVVCGVIAAIFCGHFVVCCDLSCVVAEGHVGVGRFAACKMRVFGP